jgi:hypothetical protein
MGTTLHGIVERFIPAQDGMKAGWDEVATVEFNKDYELMDELDAKAHKGWPENSWCLNDSEYEFGDCRQWLYAKEFERIVVNEMLIKNMLPSPQTFAIVAFIKELEADVRILFYRM